nr:RecName: Full=Peptide 2 [Crocodylus siamensis]
VPPHIY